MMTLINIEILFTSKQTPNSHSLAKLFETELKEHSVSVENVKPSDEICVIILIEIQIFLTVLKNPLCLGGSCSWRLYV
jgi:hypothetical protein